MNISYVGYIPSVKEYLHKHVPQDRAPAVLEVGVDRGTTLVPIVAFLARTRQQFLAVGVDVMVQEQVQLMLMNLDLLPSQQAYCIEENSLTLLPKMVEQGLKFDVFLLDGDHNYHTVKHEMELVEDLVTPTGIVIVDDYSGKWGERDLWYAERPGYDVVKGTTKRVETDKHGVKPAVDEWLDAHPNWQKSQPINGEPTLLMRKSVT